jgi:hypothetical protein
MKQEKRRHRSAALSCLEQFAGSCGQAGSKSSTLACAISTAAVATANAGLPLKTWQNEPNCVLRRHYSIDIPRKFPLARQISLGCWLHLCVRSPDVALKSYEPLQG